MLSKNELNLKFEGLTDTIQDCKQVFDAASADVLAKQPKSWNVRGCSIVIPIFLNIMSVLTNEL